MEKTTVQAVIDARLGTFAETAQPMGWFIAPPQGVRTGLTEEEREAVLFALLEDEGGMTDG